MPFRRDWKYQDVNRKGGTGGLGYAGSGALSFARLPTNGIPEEWYGSPKGASPLYTQANRDASKKFFDNARARYAEREAEERERMELYEAEEMRLQRLRERMPNRSYYNPFRDSKYRRTY